MTNPNNAIGTNGAYNGRASVEAFNDNLNIYSASGIISGWQCQPQSGMTVKLGGISGTKDVAMAVDNSGNKTIILNRLTSAVPVTLASASTTSNMIDYIVAYVNNPANVPTGGTALVDNPSICGIIPVRGSAATAPTNAQIRAAITADGGTGSTAYYVVLAQINVTKNITTITSTNIKQAETVAMNIITHGSYSTSEQYTGMKWIDGKKIYRKTINFGALPNAARKEVSHGISNLSYITNIYGITYSPNRGLYFNVPFPSYTAESAFNVVATSSVVYIETARDRSDFTQTYITIEYTKSE